MSTNYQLTTSIIIVIVKSKLILRCIFYMNV